MAYKSELSPEAERDLEAILDYLAKSYVGFGERPEDAGAKAIARVAEVRETALAINTPPSAGRSTKIPLPASAMSWSTAPSAGSL